jgi:hypothetical protein
MGTKEDERQKIEETESLPYQEITRQELEKALEKLYENYAKLLAKIKFNGSYECICGNISEKITDFFRENGIKAHYMSGRYSGRGTEFSGGVNGTGHCWVELWIRLKDTESQYLGKMKELKVIIDGAYAQFFPFELTPKATKDRQRLMVFINDKTAEEWYKGSVDNWRWKDAK